MLLKDEKKYYALLRETASTHINILNDIINDCKEVFKKQNDYVNKTLKDNFNEEELKYIEYDVERASIHSLKDITGLLYKDILYRKEPFKTFEIRRLLRDAFYLYDLGMSLIDADFNKPVKIHKKYEQFLNKEKLVKLWKTNEMMSFLIVKQETINDLKWIAEISQLISNYGKAEEEVNNEQNPM